MVSSDGETWLFDNLKLPKLTEFEWMNLLIYLSSPINDK